MLSKFKNIVFQSENDLNAWLLEMKAIEVSLVDTGLDLLQFWLHESGEVLHVNAHSGLYLGAFVDMDKLEAGKPLFIMKEGEKGFIPYERLVVEQINKVN